MKLIPLGLLGLLSLPFFAPPSSPAAAAAEAGRAARYEIDKVHSTALFRIQHLGVSYSYGRFNDVAGSFVFDSEKPEASSVTVEIQASSVDTGDAKRDNHLRSPDFLNAAEFPALSFKSREVKRGAGGKWTVVGDFSLHGVTKPLTVEADFVGAAKTQFGEKAGFETAFTIQRKDFGMDFMLDAVGNEVTVRVSLEGNLKK